jgi:hypothetical protein
MPHSVSPGCTVCESGALGARSDSGTPAPATCCAVARWAGVIGRLPCYLADSAGKPLISQRNAGRFRAGFGPLRRAGVA